MILRTVLTAAILGIAPVATAADFTVLNLNDSGAGSLRDAILQANLDPTGQHTISFDGSLGNGTILLDSMLPMVQLSGGNLTITGSGTANLAISGQNQHRILFVDSGEVTLEGVTLREGSASGGTGGSYGSEYSGGGGGGLGAGGALFVNENGNVVLRDVSLANNTALGGKGGGYLPNSSVYGGGGGGFAGDAGDAGNYSGGGGGGFAGNGGNGYYEGGGGGGGLVQDGAAGNGMSGGTGGGEGGKGGDFFQSGESGARFGGGGGGGDDGRGGTGGEFGGGGGGGVFQVGGGGGFGGGGGGAGYFEYGGSGGFGAGDGGDHRHGGDGGNGLGGAVFVRHGGVIRFENVAFSDNLAKSGMGGSAFEDYHNGSPGEANGDGLFAMPGVQATWTTPDDEDATLDPSLLGGVGLIKSGNGSLNLSGHDGTFESLTVDGGTLLVNTGVTSNVTVNAGGILGGAGSITGQLFINGTLAPGNSIGTLTVNGDATFNNGSTTEIEINDGGNTPGVHNDLINVNGNVTINGGTVSVLAELGNYTDGTTYTFLTANSVTGTFDSITDNLAFFDTFLIYNADNVQFSLIANSSDFASVAGTFNQSAVGSYLDAFSGGLVPPSLQTIIDEMMRSRVHLVRGSGCMSVIAPVTVDGRSTTCDLTGSTGDHR